jgi:hypothetical protein
MVKFAKAITRTFRHAQDCTCFLIYMYVSCGAYIKTSPSWLYLLGRKDFCSFYHHFTINDKILKEGNIVFRLPYNVGDPKFV